MQIKIIGSEEGPHLWPKRLPFWCLYFLRHKQIGTKLTPCQIKYHRYITVGQYNKGHVQEHVKIHFTRMFQEARKDFRKSENFLVFLQHNEENFLLYWQNDTQEEKNCFTERISLRICFVAGFHVFTEKKML